MVFVMLNLFQHPVRRLDLSLMAGWMLKQVQHDAFPQRPR